MEESQVERGATRVRVHVSWVSESFLFSPPLSTRLPNELEFWFASIRYMLVWRENTHRNANETGLLLTRRLGLYIHIYVHTHKQPHSSKPHKGGEGGDV